MPQIASLTYLYRNYSFEEAIARTAATGYRNVVIWNQHEQKLIFDEPGGLAKVEKLLQKYDLTPVMMFGHKEFKWDQPFEIALDQLDIAHALGIKEIDILSFFGYRSFPDEPLPQEQFDELDRKTVEYLRKVAPHAEKKGIAISIKPHTANTATAWHIADLLKRIDSPVFKACYDPGNVRYYEGVKPEDDVKHVLPHLISIIAKDHKGAQYENNFPPPGEGDVDFISIFKQAREAGFNGPVVMEKVDNAGEKLTIDQLDERLVRARLNMEHALKEAGF